jgi:hypothetical protein
MIYSAKMKEPLVPIAGVFAVLAENTTVLVAGGF